MEPIFKIEIPKPCHEDWNTMTPDETGRFCSVCTKGVMDFTEMKAPEIQAYFIKNQGQKICGRFKNEQINATFDFQIPQSVLEQRMPFHKAFLLTLFVVMGSTLFSCKNHDNATLGEVSIAKDTVESRTTMGMILPPKDSIAKTDTIKKIDVSQYITGDVSLPYDSIPKEKKTVYNANEVDKLPDYPEGLSAFYKFMSSNINIPEKSKDENQVSIVSFIIDPNGAVKDIKILRGKNQVLNNEIIRVLKTCPNWIPGEINQKKVATTYTIPIRIIP